MATTVTATETLTDPLDPSRWTTPQELCLLQAVTQCKPVGIHKHFRMLSILETLVSSGTIPEPTSSHLHCSTSEGIWRKLGSLYDLQALDEREDAIFGDVPADDDDEDDSVVEYWKEFELKGDNFQRQMWERRLADEDEKWSEDGGESPDVRMRESTVGDSEDPRSSPIGSARGTRTSGRRAVGRRLAEVKQEDTAATPGSTKGSRRASKAASPSVKDEEDTEMQDAEDEDGSGEEDDESEEEEVEDDARRGRSARVRAGVRRGRARRGRRGK